MTKKHFKAMAEIIREAKEDLRGGTPAEHVLSVLEDRVTSFCATMNPDFDRAKFLKACGIE